MPAPEPAPKRAKRADATTPEKDVVADGCDLANSAPAPLSTSLENAAPTRDDDDTLPTRDDGVDEALPTRDDDDTGRVPHERAAELAARVEPRGVGRWRCAAVATYAASSGAGARAYVGGGALEVQGVQDIRVVARCGPQELHRDHQMGPQRAVIALSLDGAPLGTEFVAGTHLVEEAALSRYVADNRYATKRAKARHGAPPAGGAPRGGGCEPHGLRPFVYHRGAAAAAATAGRVFVMLGAADLAAADKRAAPTNDIKRPWKVRERPA
ncbi:hypothetical protein JL722_1031 [Aureococcus anophagefferens]|nr:hypothetical protein JL722_1031 [Aureococcus anophagefferens]